MSMINLTYVSNVKRESLGQMDVPCDDIQTFVAELRKRLTAYGLPVSTDNEQIYLLADSNKEKISESDFPLPMGAEVYYCNIVAPQNAQEYARENGITYFFRTSENPHIYNPHIHAKYGDEDISIPLSNGQIIGEFTNKHKQKEAIRFVQSHNKDIQKEWNQIQLSQGHIK